ncbi:MAG: hypothetical protein NTW95_07485 [Candidatus Aminicenantes bacterium]|nr:hypothetical protein [Candidatus Aminicenantes bacterium]
MLQILLLLFAVGQTDQVSQSYLVMQPIQEALLQGHYSALEPICQERLSLDLEGPFALSGFLSKEQFIKTFANRLAGLAIEKLEWSSLQVEENIAVQSLNLLMIQRLSGLRIYYKLILFMRANADEKKEKEWKLYYLRGLKM